MADISKVNISNSAYKIKDSSAVAFGTCTGQASNQIKVVNIADTDWTLRVGCLIGVKFDANNTYSATTSAPVKLNVNNSGAKNVYGANTGTPTGTNNTFFGTTNYINFYMYDGTYWVWAGRSADNNTTYTNMSSAEISTGTATTARTISAKVLNDWLEVEKSKIQNQVATVVNELSAKNLLKYPYYQSAVTNNGVTFTAHSDGIITTSGTASASATANFLVHARAVGETNDFVLKNGTYLVNGCASGGSNNKWYVGYQRTNENNQFETLAVDYGNGDTELVLNGDYYSNDEVNLQVVVAIAKGVNADGLVFKPMIRPKNIIDDTYVPYAMTNQELTKAVLELLSRIN